MSFFTNLIELSNDKDGKNCIHEWVIISLKQEHKSNTEIRCVCSRSIKFFYYAINTENDNMIKVGTDCLKRFYSEDVLKEKRKKITINNNIQECFNNGRFIKILDLCEYTKNIIIEYLTYNHIEIIKNALIVYKDNEILFPIINKIYEEKVKRLEEKVKRLEEKLKIEEEIRLNKIKRDEEYVKEARRLEILKVNEEQRLKVIKMEENKKNIYEEDLICYTRLLNQIKYCENEILLNTIPDGKGYYKNDKVMNALINTLAGYKIDIENDCYKVYVAVTGNGLIFS